MGFGKCGRGYLFFSFIFFKSRKAQDTKRARQNKIAAGIANLNPLSIITTEKLYNPWQVMAISAPKITKRNGFFLKYHKAMKYPIVAEHKAWRNVAPTNLIPLIVKISKNSDSGNNIKIFSTAANPSAAIII